VPDRVYFSAWLRGADPQILPGLEKVLKLVPFSRLRPDCSLTIYAVEYSEPTASDVRFDHAPDPAEIVAYCREFENSDCAYQLDAYWDLWRRDDGDGEWKLAPAPISITAYGPDFSSDLGEHFRLDFGLDALFLPSTDSAAELTAIRSNIRSLLHLTGDLAKNMTLEKKTLWSEGGDNLAAQLSGIVAGLSG
jgi:hypothetical protein